MHQQQPLKLKFQQFSMSRRGLQYLTSPGWQVITLSSTAFVHYLILAICFEED